METAKRRLDQKVDEYREAKRAQLRSESMFVSGEEMDNAASQTVSELEAELEGMRVDG